jgi:hypothetical protein
MSKSKLEKDRAGNKCWYLNGKLHREDGPAIIFRNSDKHWYLNGKLHRVDGPACEYIDGTKYWFLNGDRHRTDGPAIEAFNKKYWYLNGVEYSKEEWLKALTVEQQINYLWNLDNQ